MLKSVIIQVKKVTCESMLEFIPMQIEDSKSLAQSGRAQRMKMLMPSWIDRRKVGMIIIRSSSGDCGNCLFHLCT